MPRLFHTAPNPFPQASVAAAHDAVTVSHVNTKRPTAANDLRRVNGDTRRFFDLFLLNRKRPEPAVGHRTVLVPAHEPLGQRTRSARANGAGVVGGGSR